jgi:protein SCO1/2
MRTKITKVSLLLLVILVSVLIMTLPTFQTKELSRIVLSQQIDFDMLLDTKQDVELLFFGYAGCVDVCTPRLSDLGRWYASLPEKMRERVGLKFIDLSVPEQKDLPMDFAKAFHPDFQGIFLSESELRRYTKAFSVYFSSSLTQKSEFNHTAHLYLLKRDSRGKRLRFVYSAYPYDFQQIKSDIEELIHE